MMQQATKRVDAVEYAAGESGNLRLLAEVADRRAGVEAELAEAREEVANLRLQNAKLKFWVHRAGLCTLDGEKIEGRDG